MDQAVCGCILRDNSDPSRMKSAVDGLQLSCGVNDDYVVKMAFSL
jgi:hypothetical protein